MASATGQSIANPPIPTDLPRFLPSPKTPWHMSVNLFSRIQKQMAENAKSNKAFIAVEVSNQDAEHAFVLRYFNHQKPPGYGIKRILCLHNPDLTKGFEAAFKSMEAGSKAFPPTWDKEDLKVQRSKTIQRWKSSVAPFSPFEVRTSKRVDTFVDTKIIPLWHGSKHVESICEMGFTYFGKHHLVENAIKTAAIVGQNKSTDIGYFGSGIYFTNSAQYSTLYNRNSGKLILSWVAMREPYPVVNDVPCPKKGSDMIKLEGRGAYSNYNAHYIPVTSTNAKNPKHMEYHPCHYTEEPDCDEYVVFQFNQTLPRFVVELAVDLPVAPSNSFTVERLNEYLLQLLANSEIKKDKALAILISQKISELFALNPKSHLEANNKHFYIYLSKVINAHGKVDSIARDLFLSQVVNSSNKKESNAKEVMPLHASTYGMSKKDTGYPLPAKDETALESDDYLPTLEDEVYSKELSNLSISIVDKFGQNHLHKAAVEGDLKKIRFFIKKIDIESKDNDGATPLLAAAYVGNREAFNLLKKAGANILATYNGLSTLHFAAKNGWLDIIQLLLGHKNILHSSCTLTVIPNTGIRVPGTGTPLHYAIANRQKAACKIILNADFNTANDMSLKLAKITGDIDVITLVTVAISKLTLPTILKTTALVQDSSNTLHKADKIVISAPEQSIDKEASSKEVVSKQDVSAHLFWSTKNIPHPPKINAVPMVTPSVIKLYSNNDAVDAQGRNVLHRAAEAGENELLKSLITQKLHLIESRDELGNTPLILAAFKDHVQSCQILVGAQAKIDAVNVSGSNALEVAAMAGNAAATTYFVQFKQLIESRNTSDQTPILSAANRRKRITFDILLQAGANIFATSQTGNLLYHAAAVGWVDIVQLVIVRKEFVNSIVGDCFTPLHQAVYFGHLVVCNMLLKAGADIRAVDKSGKNIIAMAEVSGKKDIIKWVNDHLDPKKNENSVDVQGRNVLHRAAEVGENELLKSLIMQKPHLIDSPDRLGYTPLILAASKDHVQCCQILIGAQVKIEAVSFYGRNALEVAAMVGNAAATTYFVQFKQLIESRNIVGETPILSAAISRFRTTFDILLKAGANIFAISQMGNLLHHAAAAGWIDIVKLVIIKKEFVNSQASDGSTPLHYAAYNGQLAICNMLLDAGANIRAVDNNGNSILAMAKASGKEEIIKLVNAHLYLKKSVKVAQGSSNLLEQDSKLFESQHLDFLHAKRDRGLTREALNKEAGKFKAKGDCIVFDGSNQG